MTEIIKKSDVVEILKEKVFNEIAHDFEREGFKYLRSSNSFVRKIDHYRQVIGFHSNEINTINDQIHLTFRVASRIELPKYTKWVQQRQQFNRQFIHSIDNHLYSLEITNAELQSLSTYSPTKSQMFKSKVSSMIRGAQDSETPTDFRVNQSEIIKSFIKGVEEMSDIKLLYQNRKGDRDMLYIRLLEYFDYPELAKVAFKEQADFWRNLIETSSEINDQNRPIAISNFNKFVTDTNQTLNLAIPLL